MDKYEPFKIPIPVLGLNWDDEPTQLKGQSPYLLNFVVEPTLIRKRAGLVQVGATSLPLTGTGMHAIRYTDARADIHTVVLTSSDAYVYNAALDQWDEITPTGGDFTGNEDNIWHDAVAHDAVEFPANGGTALLISNDTDGPFFFEGDTGDKFTALDTSDFTSFSSTKELVEFWNTLFFLNYTTSARNCRSAAHCVAGDADNWTGATAGIFVLTDSIGQILNTLKLGYELIIYSENSITVGQRIGGQLLFTFPTTIYNLGAFSERSVYGLGDYHILFATDKKVYRFYGENLLKPIGHGIERRLFSDINPQERHKCHIGQDSLNRRVFFFYPSSSSEYPEKAMVLNYASEIPVWEHYEYKVNVQGTCMFSFEGAYACNDPKFAGVSCSELSAGCNEMAFSSGAPTILFVTNDGYTLTPDSSLRQDDGNNYLTQFETPDVIADGEEYWFRTEFITFEAKAAVANSTINLHYSVDGGENWTQIDDDGVLDISISDGEVGVWKHHKIPLDVTTRRFRIRFSQESDKDIQLRHHVGVHLQARGKYD